MGQEEVNKSEILHFLGRLIVSQRNRKERGKKGRKREEEGKKKKERKEGRRGREREGERKRGNSGLSKSCVDTRFTLERARSCNER